MSRFISANRLIASGFTALALCSVAALPAFADGDPTGVWIDNTGRGAVEIAPCGKGLCGKVVWVASQKDREGCGEQIIGNVRPVGGGRWDNGWIYNPADGRKYDVELKPLSGDRLRVMGYAGIKLFSETYVWKRAPADLKRCDGVQQASTAPETDVPSNNSNAAAPAQSASSSIETLSATTTREGTGAKLIETQPERSAAAAPPPAPAPEEEPAATADSGDRDGSAGGKAGGPGGINLGGLALDKVVKKTANGNCRLDLPWFKVNFDCSKL